MIDIAVIIVIVICRCLFVVLFTELKVSCLSSSRLRSGCHARGLKDATDAGVGKELQDLLLGYCTAAKRKRSAN